MDPIVLTYALNLLYQLAILTLAVLGLAIVFGLLGIMNMAHGEFMMLGAYSVVIAHRTGIGDWLGIPIAVVICAAIGYLSERLLIRHISARPIDGLLATWGLSILMRKSVEALFGRGFQSVDSGMAGMVPVLGTLYPTYRIALIGFVLVAVTLMTLWYRRSSAGVRVRAMVANRSLAEAIGINTRRLATQAFVIGVTLAGFAGALLAPLTRIEPGMGLDSLMSSFFVLVVGGLGTLTGVLAGVAVIGGTQSLVSSIFDQTYGYVAVLVVAIYFLWRRPDGLFARA